MKPVEKQLRILIIEDSPDDCELITMDLKRSGLSVDVTRKDVLATVEQAIAAGGWDAYISDYKLGGFTAEDVLGLYHKYRRDAPFIVVSGTIGEETAAKLMRSGAHDFFLKERLGRLGTALEREVREAGIRAEHRIATERLKESEEQFRTVANAAPVMIWGATNAMHRNFFNVPWLTFRGRTLEQEADDGWMEGIHLDDIDRLKTLHAEAFAARREFSTGYRLRRFDGEYRYILERAVPRTIAGQGFAGYLGSCMDITEQKITEEALRDAVKTRDDFLSAASHELQTPLTSLLLQIEMLQREVAKGGSLEGTLRKRIAGVENQAGRLSKLVGRLLDVTRITAGRLQLTPVKTDLRAIVLEVVNSMQQPAERAGSPITIDAPEPVFGMWDPVHMETVVSNLLTNAVKYGAEKPIEITLAINHKVARLTVADHGIGIDLGSHGRIFERFERGVPEMNYSGLGIGLWVVRQVVTAHGGTVQVESKKGEGATFVVELPVEA